MDGGKRGSVAWFNFRGVMAWNCVLSHIFNEHINNTTWSPPMSYT